MTKGHLAGVQSLPLDEAVVAAVEVVSQKRMAKMCKMDTDLVCAACFQSEGKQRECIGCF